MLQNGLINGENLQLRPLRVVKINPVAPLFQFEHDAISRNRLRNGAGFEVQSARVDANFPFDHLVAQVRVEQAGLESLMGFVQAGSRLARRRKTVIGIPS